MLPVPPGPAGRRATGGARGAASGFPQGMTFRRAAIGCAVPSSPFMDTAPARPGRGSHPRRSALPRLPRVPALPARPPRPARGGRARHRPRPSRGAGASKRSRGQRSAGAAMVGAGRGGSFRGVPPGRRGARGDAVDPRPAAGEGRHRRCSELPSRGAGVCRVRVPPVPCRGRSAQRAAGRGPRGVAGRAGRGPQLSLSCRSPPAPAGSS